MEGNFCKHMVALGLTVLAQRESLPRQRKAARDRAQDLGGWLSGLSKGELLALVRERVGEERQLRRRLELRVASARGDLAAVRARIRDLLSWIPPSAPTRPCAGRNAEFRRPRPRGRRHRPWQAATETGAHDQQWLTLADQTRAARPAGVLGVYRRLADPLTKQTGDTVYEELVSPGTPDDRAGAGDSSAQVTDRRSDRTGAAPGGFHASSPAARRWGSPLTYGCGPGYSG